VPHRASSDSCDDTTINATASLRIGRNTATPVSLFEHVNYDSLMGCLYFMYSGQLPYLIDTSHESTTIRVAHHPFVSFNNIVDAHGHILPYWQQLFAAAELLELYVLQQLLLLDLSVILMNAGTCSSRNVVQLLTSTLNLLDTSPSPRIRKQLRMSADTTAMPTHETAAYRTRVVQLCCYYFLIAENNIDLCTMELIDSTPVSTAVALEILTGNAIRSLANTSYSNQWINSSVS
jgi:hypothetical protein